MNSKYSEKEAIQRMSKLPGFELDDDGFGYKVMSPKGLSWFRGGRLSDEGFESETFGSLNISEMYRLFGGSGVPPMQIAVEDAVANTANSVVDPAYAKRITQQRLREPVLAAFAHDGYHVIDGSHRIYRLNKLRKKWVSVWFVRPELLRVTRIRRFLLGPNGVWQDDDTISQAQFERELARAAIFVEGVEAKMHTVSWETS